jgi:hypothetical protein
LLRLARLLFSTRLETHSAVMRGRTIARMRPALQ